jgi:hypothetical protein
LHLEHPTKSDFTIDEIMERASKESKQPLRPGVYVHIIQHCVANRPPNPGRYRMLFETAPGRRRLFRTGDGYDPARDGTKITPARENIPSKYADLLDWYREWSQTSAKDRVENDPLLALHADEYIRRLREGWE